MGVGLEICTYFAQRQQRLCTCLSLTPRFLPFLRSDCIRRAERARNPSMPSHCLGLIEYSGILPDGAGTDAGRAGRTLCIAIPRLSPRCDQGRWLSNPVMTLAAHGSNTYIKPELAKPQIPMDVRISSRHSTYPCEECSALALLHAGWNAVP